MDNIFYVFAALVFAAVIFLVEGLSTWWTSTRGAAAKRIEQRLRMLSAGAHGGGEELSILKQRHLSESPAFDRFLLQVPRIHTLDRTLAQSGVGWTVSRFLGYSVVAFMLGSMSALLLRMPPWIAFVIGLSLLFVPLMRVLRSRQRRLKQLEEQLPEAADLISRALRAGHAFPSTLQMAGEEMPEPISGEFRIAFDEINYGVPMNDALQNLATRVPLTDLRYFVIAVLIQRESGGNLAEILTNISQIIRERLKLLASIRVLSAEGRLSAWILGLLPFCVGMLINILNPKYLDVMWTDPIGMKLVGSAAVSMTFGILWMRSIIRIRI